MLFVCDRIIFFVGVLVLLWVFLFCFFLEVVWRFILYINLFWIGFYIIFNIFFIVEDLLLGIVLRRLVLICVKIYFFSLKFFLLSKVFIFLVSFVVFFLVGIFFMRLFMYVFFLIIWDVLGYLFVFIFVVFFNVIVVIVFEGLFLNEIFCIIYVFGGFLVFIFF